ncbi:multicopper oxidase domain-containing protein [Haloarchaeobius sp. DYHT-AS-18]|uniref:multicopper oxidase domain-containing protein n=1 Tax=Haloarchaeobius sp. DYHT-AS-18 TaxID=3446117 RepID=UPI003EBF2941
MTSMDYGSAQSLTERLEGKLTDTIDVREPVSRRAVLGGLSILGGAALTGIGSADGDGGHAAGDDHGDHGNFGAVGEYTGDEFDPHEFLTEFNTGDNGDGSDLDPNVDVYQENGRTVREFNLTAIDVEIEILPGIKFPMWTYNGQVPGPTIRVEEGDLVRINFRNGSDKHAHTIHPHLKNLNPDMDGTPTNGPGLIEPGDEPFTYEWQAEPMGTHLYHCHTMPLKAHVHRGLYGAMIVDPKPERVRENPRDYVNYHGPMTDELVDELVERAKSRNMVSYADYAPEGFDGVNEMVMVMNGFDTNFDGGNEVYAVNTRGFCYGVGQTDGKGSWAAGETKKPIQIDRNELQRVHLVNMIEFDLINSFHTHSQFFDYYDAGTTLLPTRSNIDTVMQCQAQRGVFEIDYSDHDPGLYMFHAHQSEFAELGWMSFFEVV